MATPVNRQAALFLSRKPRCETVKEAIDGAINHLMSGKFNEQLADVFASGGFGPDPSVTFSVTIRHDATDATKYVYTSTTKVTHDMGTKVNLFGLKDA